MADPKTTKQDPGEEAARQAAEEQARQAEEDRRTAEEQAAREEMRAELLAAVRDVLAELAAPVPPAPAGSAGGPTRAADVPPAGTDSPTIWVMSNRVDDRVVLWEQNPQHPGGEAFIAGPTPEHVGRTPQIEGLLREGLLVIVPEPPDSRKKPVAIGAALGSAEVPDQPGRRIRLGRVPDPDLVPEGALAQVAAQQERVGDEIPAPPQAIVPPEPAPERATTRR